MVTLIHLLYINLIMIHIKLICIICLPLVAGNIKSGVKIFNVTGTLTVQSLGGTIMKSITKTYTNSDANGSANIASGLTSAQAACVYAVTINSFSCSNQNGNNWASLGGVPSSYNADTSSRYGNTTWVYFNKPNNTVFLYSGGSTSITYYYFE